MFRATDLVMKLVVEPPSLRRRGAHHLQDKIELVSYSPSMTPSLLNAVLPMRRQLPESRREALDAVSLVTVKDSMCKGDDGDDA